MLQPCLRLLPSPRRAESRRRPRLFSRPGRPANANTASAFANSSPEGIEQVPHHLGSVDHQLCGTLAVALPGLLHQPDQRRAVEIAGLGKATIRLIARDGAAGLAIEAAIERPGVEASRAEALLDREPVPRIQPERLLGAF